MNKKTIFHHMIFLENIKAMQFILCFILIFLFAIEAHAVPPLPFRIIGTLSVNGDDVNLADSGYTLDVTKLDGSSYDPAVEVTDGLSQTNGYIIYIPTYHFLDQPGGAHSGETAVIHVNHNNDELTITSPPSGTFQVGNPGNIQEVHTAAQTDSNPSTPQLIYPLNEQECSRTTVQFIWQKSSTINGGQLTYDLHICEDEGLSTGCIILENIAYIYNSRVDYAGIGPWILISGIFLSGIIFNKRKETMLLMTLLVIAALIVSCGSGTNSNNGTCEHPSVPDINTQSEIVQEISGLKSGKTYYWKVTVTDENSNKVHSETRSFTTE